MLGLPSINDFDVAASDRGHGLAWRAGDGIDLALVDPAGVLVAPPAAATQDEVPQGRGVLGSTCDGRTMPSATAPSSSAPASPTGASATAPVRCASSADCPPGDVCGNPSRAPTLARPGRGVISDCRPAASGPPDAPSAVCRRVGGPTF